MREVTSRMSADPQELEPGAAIERFVSELVRWRTRPDVRRSMRDPRRAAGDELSATDVWLLRYLHEAGASRPGDLAAFQGVDKSTVTSQLRRLEDRKLVRRTADPSDRRAALVGLTALGRRRHDAAAARAQGVLDGLVDDWSERDRAQLARLLGRLTDRLQRD
jgi:DNA-binding MarR family transcriptional regulator